MRKLRVLLLSVLLIPLGLGYGLVLFYDSGQLGEELTSQLSRALNRPVTVDKVVFRLLPRPHLEVQRLRIALDDRRPPLTLGSVAASLDPLALLEGKWVIPAIRIQDLVVIPADYAALNALIEPPEGQSAAAPSAWLPVNLRRLELRRVTWVQNQTDFYGPYHIDVQLTEQLQPARVVMRTLQAELTLQLAWQGELLLVEAQARDWQPPVADFPVVNLLELRGKLFGSRLVINDGSLKLAAGELAVQQAVFDWTEQVSISADFDLQRLDLPTLMAELGHASLPGQFQAGSCEYGAQGIDWNAAVSLFQLNCRARYIHDGRHSPMVMSFVSKTRGHRFDLTATDFLLPVGPALLFDRLSLKGMVSGEQAEFETITADAYHGQLTGSAHLEWSDGLSLNFDAQGEGVELEPMLLAFANESLSGRMSSRCAGGLELAASGQLVSRDIACDVLIKEGVVKNADLENAAKLVGKEADGTGQTPFEHCQAGVHMLTEAVHLRDIAIRSAVLEGTGELSVTKGNALDGEIKVAVKRTAGVVGVPLRVSGSLDSPEILPTRSAMAGGAAGTVILGPGLGTAIGVKVGEAFGKLGRMFKGREGGAGASADGESRDIPVME